MPFSQRWQTGVVIRNDAVVMCRSAQNLTQISDPPSQITLSKLHQQLAEASRIIVVKSASSRSRMDGWIDSSRIIPRNWARRKFSPGRVALASSIPYLILTKSAYATGRTDDTGWRSFRGRGEPGDPSSNISERETYLGWSVHIRGWHVSHPVCGDVSGLRGWSPGSGGKRDGSRKVFDLDTPPQHRTSVPGFPKIACGLCCYLI
jgi:hypothetical protein